MSILNPRTALVFISFMTACSETPVGVTEDPISEVRIVDSEGRMLGIGSTLELEAQVFRGSRVDASEQVSWRSRDVTVVTVEKGVLTAVGYGSTTITATANGESDSFDVEVVGAGDFTYASGDIMISARLRLPQGAGPFPAIVTVHGSERARKESYQVPSLVSAGFAVLSYDKRGVGNSTGTYPSVSPSSSKVDFGLLAGDALAGVTFLKGHADIDPDRIGLMGWSQAGWIIPLAASRSADVKFMVNVVGPTVTVGQEIYFSNLTGDSGTGPLPGGLTYEEAEAMTEEFVGAHGYDPVPVLRQVEIPGLWVLGGADRSIPTNLTIARIEELVAQYAKPFEYHYYENGDHGLRDVTNSQQIPYITRSGGVISWIRGR